MPKKSALIIGINEYAHFEEKYQLKGCVNDAILIKDVLVNQFKFEASEITELHNQAASRDGILAAMEGLVERTEKDDIVVFHYSGHGSQRESADLEEGTGMDSTIVPHDSGYQDPYPNLGIADNEINEWLGRLSEKTRYITLIFDCCHSGTMTRDVFGARTRSVPADTRSLTDMGIEPRQPAPKGAVQTRNVGPSGWLTLSDSYVVMSGCRDNEQASEYHHEDGDGHVVTTGALTYFLTNALRQAQPGTTYRDVFELARQHVINEISAQHPQIEGIQDREIFGIKDIEPLRFIPVTAVNGSTVILAGGLAHGLERDSLWSAYPQGTKQTKGSTPVGLVEITNVDMLTAEGIIREGKGAIDVGARCVEKEPAASQYRLGIYLSGLDEATRAAFASRIEQSHLLDVASAPGSADLCAYVVQPRETSSATDSLPQIGRIDQLSWAIVNREGECAIPLAAVNEDSVIDKLIDNVETLARYRNALRLDNPTSDLNVEFNIYRVLENGDLENANSGDFQFDAGDYVAFEIINNGDQQVFANVLDFGLSGKVSLMFPTRRAGELIEAGRTLRFGTGKAKIRLGVPDKVLTKHETFKAFISSNEADFRWLQQDGLRSADSRRSSLRKQFEAAYNGPSSRESEVIGDEDAEEDWKAISRSFKLQKRRI